MNFLVDAQLPKLLAIRLCDWGHPAKHTLDMTQGNRTSDQDISIEANATDAVVITKDLDFMNSQILSGLPRKLLIVSTGNISNRELFTLFSRHIDLMVSELESSDLVEINQTGLIVHDSF